MWRRQSCLRAQAGLPAPHRDRHENSNRLLRRVKLSATRLQFGGGNQERAGDRQRARSRQQRDLRCDGRQQANLLEARHGRVSKRERNRRPTEKDEEECVESWFVARGLPTDRRSIDRCLRRHRRARRPRRDPDFTPLRAVEKCSGARPVRRQRAGRPPLHVSKEVALRGTIAVVPVGDDTIAYRGRLPHLCKDEKTYFVTFCTRGRQNLPPAARDIVLDCCVYGHQRYYWLHCAVVMPDHVHLILAPVEDQTLPRIMQRLKSASSHMVNSGRLWQRESFDHILRREEKLAQKIAYVCDNPVRKGLVGTADEYRWLWRSWL